MADEMSAAEKRARVRHPSNVANDKHKTDNAERSKALRHIGRCGSLSEHAAFVCTLLSHDSDTNHRQEEMGGKDDGLVYAEWAW
jgi:hypothetical protein